MKTEAASTNKVIDPICGMKVDPCKTNLVTDYQGNRYYFCAEACRQAFDTDPRKYAVAEPAKRMGFWRRYLNRLNKATGGKPPQCH